MAAGASSHGADGRGARGGRDTAHAASRATLGAILARRAHRSPERIAVQEVGGRHRTFADLDEQATRVAAALAAGGVRPGDRVAVLARNRVEVVESYFGIARLGAVVVPLNYRLAPAEVAHLAVDAGFVALVVEPELAHLRIEAMSHLPAGRVLVTGDPGAVGVAYDLALADADVAAFSPPDVTDGDPAFLMYTSGTTGRPKGAIITHQNLFATTANHLVEFGYSGPDEVRLSGLPMFHIGGLSSIVVFVVSGGRQLILPPGSFDARTTLEVLVTERVTAATLVPTQWQDVCALALDEPRDTSSLTRIVWGAAAAPEQLVDALAAAFPNAKIFNGFGQTETTSAVCVLKPDDLFRRRGSIGRPMLHVDLRLVDDDTVDVAPGDVGEIVYRGPTVFDGYWRRPEDTEAAFAGGWFHSGDLAKADEDGFLYLVDRKKDMILSGGENIYSAEVEAVLAEMDAVEDVAVVGIPHERWGETPLAVVVLRPDAPDLTLEDVTTWCASRLASYKKPTVLVVTDELPRNASGKVLKRVLRDQHAAPARPDHR